MQPEEMIRKLIEFNTVLGDGVRLAIMLYLRIKGRARFSELASVLGISPGRLAHHLEVLGRANYVIVDRMREDLRGRIVKITPDGAEALKSYLSSIASAMREFT